MNKKDKWKEYYKNTTGRMPRKLLIEALTYCKNTGMALDLGAGDLTDSMLLLDKGFLVTAVDSSLASEKRAQIIDSENFTFVRNDFESFNFKLSSYVLVSAQFSLPFNRPETFAVVFKRIKDSLISGGIFTGQYFGVNDEWNTVDSGMTFCTRQKVKENLKDMEIIKLEEEEKDGQTASGIPKHWHIFSIIVRK